MACHMCGGPNPRRRGKVRGILIEGEICQDRKCGEVLLDGKACEKLEEAQKEELALHKAWRKGIKPGGCVEGDCGSGVRARPRC